MNKKPEVLIIKIDQSTIKENPYYGYPVIIAPGRKTIRFKMEGHLPKEMQDNKMVHISNTYYLGHGEEAHDGYIHDPDFAKELEAKKIKGLEITIEIQKIEIDNSDAEKYLYSYEPTYVQCNKSKCKEKVLVSALEIDCDDEGNCFPICPKCGWIGTFPEYEYQNIKEVIND